VTLHSFILKNALRNKRRAALCLLSVAVSLFLLVTLLVFLRELTLPPEDVGTALRMVVRSRTSLGTLLPARQRAVLERIPGVAAVTPFTFFGGRFRDESVTLFAQFAIDAKQLRKVFGEAKMAPEQYAAFEAEKTACIIGKITADKYGLKIGDRLPFTGTYWPCNLELKVAGIYQGTIDDRNLLFHHEYLEEASGVRGYAGTWWVKAASMEVIPATLARINQTFANTSAEVRAETERTFQLSMVSMWANIKILVRSICSVVIFSLLLVSASTMSMAIRERFRELAMLRALGFRRRDLFIFILAESFGLAMAGGFLGIGGAWLVFTHGETASNVAAVAGAIMGLAALVQLIRSRSLLGVAFNLTAATVLAGMAWTLHLYPNISRMTNGILLTFEVTPGIMGTAALVAACLGIISSLTPYLSVARLSVVEGLATLD
jgi:putative ABC transport system permease protein